MAFTLTTTGIINTVAGAGAGVPPVTVKVPGTLTTAGMLNTAVGADGGFPPVTVKVPGTLTTAGIASTLGVPLAGVLVPLLVFGIVAGLVIAGFNAIIAGTFTETSWNKQNTLYPCQDQYKPGRDKNSFCEPAPCLDNQIFRH